MATEEFSNTPPIPNGQESLNVNVGVEILGLSQVDARLGTAKIKLQLCYYWDDTRLEVIPQRDLPAALRATEMNEGSIQADLRSARTRPRTIAVPAPCTL